MKIILLFLFLFACSVPKQKCLKIGMTYQEVLSSCGQPILTDYKNGELNHIFYRSPFIISNELYVSFENGIVDYYSYSQWY